MTTEMRRRFLKAQYESPTNGLSVFYVEFTGDEPTRQVTMIGDRWAHSRRDGGRPDPQLTDQPLYEHDLQKSDDISAEQFEEVWNEALARDDV